MADFKTKKKELLERDPKPARFPDQHMDTTRYNYSRGGYSPYKYLTENTFGQEKQGHAHNIKADLHKKRQEDPEFDSLINEIKEWEDELKVAAYDEPSKNKRGMLSRLARHGSKPREFVKRLYEKGGIDAVRVYGGAFSPRLREASENEIKAKLLRDK